MNRTFSKVMWMIAGIFLIIAGIICLRSPSAGLSAISLLLGSFLLVSGIIDIMVFARGHNIMYGAGWFLADGILTVIMALFILFNQTFDSSFYFRDVDAFFRYYEIRTVF